MAQALCMPHNKGYKHTLRICNVYCVSTATVVAGTRLDVPFVRTYVHCLPCLMLNLTVGPVMAKAECIMNLVVAPCIS